MKKVLTLLLPLVIALSGCQAKGATPEKKDTQQQLLFVLHGKKGSYSNRKLTIMNVDQKITYFTDRPERKAGKMDLNDFLKAWDTNKGGNFTHNPPNSGFVFFEGKNSTYSDVPVKLMHPQYNQQSQTVTFDVKVLEDKQLPEHQTLDEVTLFIDSGKTTGPLIGSGDGGFQH